jgi:hypothetical protein
LADDAPLDTLDLLADPAVLNKHLELAKEGKGLFYSGVVGVSHLPLSQLSPRAPELQARIGKLVDDFEAEIVQLEKSGTGEGDIAVKKGLLEQYKLLKERYSDKKGEGSPGFQWISFPACLSSPSKHIGMWARGEAQTILHLCRCTDTWEEVCYDDVSAQPSILEGHSRMSFFVSRMTRIGIYFTFP